MDLFDGLNRPQLEAVNHTTGPLLIMAGAGSGKTRVLTCRIANLIRQGVNPYNILAITFTNKAANEMLERVNALEGEVAKNICFTFHSFCARLLRREIEATGIYNKNFTIYDATDSLALVKACVKELNLDEKQYNAGNIRNDISDAKNKLLSPIAYAKQAQGQFHEEKVAAVYGLYEKKLQGNNALDFDDLLLVTVRLLQKNDAVREKYQNRFHYLLVDEYQDTNGAQYQITKLLAAKYKNLCVVGDADQSIYGWRGADMHNILDFEKDYPEAKVILLEENYRSTGYILDAANSLIKRNIDRRPKNLWTKKPQGEKISYYTAKNETDEAYFVANTIMENRDQNRFGYNDTAVLYRTNAQSRKIEDVFMSLGLPYTMVGALKFYERKEIKDIMAYLKVIVNPLDDLSLLRIINVPKRSLGSTTIAKITAYAAEHEASIFDVISDDDLRDKVPGLSARALGAIEKFVLLIFGFMGNFANTPVDKLIDDILTDSGYWKELEADEKDGPGRKENLQEFIGVAREFQKKEADVSLPEFLARLSLITDLDNTDLTADRVTMMTFHAAKGLEFPAVFMVGMEEGLFPHTRTLLEESELEEERRACYVGITRAQKKLYLTNAFERTIYGRTNRNAPSRFIGEIDENCLEMYGLAQKKTSDLTPNLTASPSGLAAWERVKKTTMRPNAQVQPAASVIKPDLSVKWRSGDKVRHGKWGIGTIVQVKEAGEDTELTIAFPDLGIKKMMQIYAPIVRAEG